MTAALSSDGQRALLAIALMAAFADGAKADAEREEIRRIAADLGAQAAGLNLNALVQDVLLQRIRLADQAAALTEPAHRQLAYELALGVCEADGGRSQAETRFLADLKAALGLDGGATAGAEQGTEALASVIDRPAAALPAQAAPAPATPAVDEAALERSVMKHAILAGALELLPQSWASMAIIPLQVKMVYGIGQAHGVQLDGGHIKEFIATVGVGMTSQYLEQFGRKLLGGLLGKVAGGIGRGVGSAGAGMAMSFATTYALGQVARRYYGGGRQMSTTLLQQTFQSMLGDAKALQQRTLPQIEQRARTLDMQQVLDLVREPLA